jgi:3'-phosphoadenosine 5'-phosphosulfate sulfotransferase (PAPS reductase)/FAD synthetase
MSFLIQEAIKKGGCLVSSVSGGKDGQAMTKSLVINGFPIHSMVHADLGEVEWKESLFMCQKQADEFNIPLVVVRRNDKLGLLEYWQKRMYTLKDTGKPFWSSSKNRYCTSDLKREPINAYLRKIDNNLIVSCEGIRAQESSARAKKNPLTIRAGVTSSFYNNMSVAEAIENYRPDKRLVLTWYPIFNYSLDEVWATYGCWPIDIECFRSIYKRNGYVSELWPFHPAYVYGNDRVSCVFCILGSKNDLSVGAKQRPELLDKMIAMEEEGNATFKNNWSLKELIK